MKRALIFGVDGQDGSYLAELLLSKGYAVAGWVPSDVPVSLANIQPILEQVTLLRGSLLEQEALLALVDEQQPDEVYNLAAPSFPAGTWSEAVAVGDAAGLGVARILEALRLAKPAARFYQASTSELFGVPIETPQDENTAFHPRNPYGVAKLYAHWMTINYRVHHGMHASAGILFNHESPRRGATFVTRKITQAVARIKLGLQQELHLGDLEARRDWGYAGDYVQAMWLMLQQDTPQEYVIGSGQTHSVRRLCELAFACVGLDYRQYVVVDPAFVRPPETAQLVANPQRALQCLDWQPHTSFEQLLHMMVEHDLRLAGKQAVG